MAFLGFMAGDGGLGRERERERASCKGSKPLFFLFRNERWREETVDPVTAS